MVEPGPDSQPAEAGSAPAQSTAPTHASTPIPTPTWTDPKAWRRLGITVALGLSADLASKWAAFRWIAGQSVTVRRSEVLEADTLFSLIPSHRPVVVVPSVLDLTLVLNPGAVFGIGAGKRWLFVAFTVVAIAFGLWMFGAWTTRRQRIAHMGIGLLLAGGLGNLYDRVRFACVRDFIHPLPGVLWPGGWSFPGGGREVWPYVSNIADLLLLIGIGLLLGAFWKRSPAARGS